MRHSLFTRALAVGALAALAVTGTAVAQTADGVVPSLTAAMLPDEVLDDLPADAEEAGYDYAPRLVVVRTDSREQRNDVVASGLDVTEHAGPEGIQVVLADQDDQDVLDALGIKYDVVIPDMIARQTQRILADAAYFRAASAELPSGRTSYRNLEDFGAEIDQLVADNPDIAKRISLGESFEGRDLTGIEIGADVDAPEDGRPVLLMFGNHHAREWPSATAPMEFAHELVNNHAAGDPRTVDLLSRARVIIVPVSNPDGYRASRITGDMIDLNAFNDQDPLGGTTVILATPGNAYKRKNCHPFPSPEPLPADGCLLTSSPGGKGIGIDLNRNYGALWGGPGAAGVEPDPDEGINGDGPNSAIFRGDAPFSEPETQAIRTLISTRQVTTLISNHTFSNLLLRPVGVEPTTEHPDGFPIGFAPDECFTTADGSDSGMQALGERMTAQTGYSNQFGWELYDTTGTTEDYSYNATGGYGYTFEIGPDEFHPPFEEVVAEYLGTTDAAEAITPDSAPGLTTATRRDCEGDAVDHDTVGGGLREAYYIALANAADPRTHSVLAGTAPAGAEISVTRSGTFPLWDGTPFEDTVTTSMTVPGGDVVAAATGDTGVPFEYHVNPSTRPFSDSRAYLDPDAPAPVREEISSEEVTGAPSAPGNEDDILIEVTAGSGVESLSVTVTPDVETDDFDLELISPDGVVLDTAGNFGGVEEVEHRRIGGNGIAPGTYVLRVTNFAAAAGYTADISLGNFPDYEPPAELETPRTTEAWTVTCSLDGEQLAQRTVQVDRGETADLGVLCVAAAGTEPPAPAPDPDTDDDPDLAATGGGAAALAALALGGAVALAGRRRED